MTFMTGFLGAKSQRPFAQTMKLLLVGTVVHVGAAMAGDLSDGAARVGRDARTENRRATAYLEALKEEPPQELIVGASYDKDESSVKVWSTPFDWSYKFKLANGKTWKLKVTGDGLEHDSSPDASGTGLADVKVLAFYPLIDKALTGAIGLSIPTHGAVGSRYAGQLAKLIYGLDLSPVWSVTLIGTLAHKDHSMAGVSQYTRVAYAEVDYQVSDGHTVLAGIRRGVTGGAGGTTDASLEYDFPLAAKFGGQLSVTRGLTSGQKHTGFEFDISHRF